MNQQRIKPSPALADIVESIWIQEDLEARGEQEPSCVLPTGTVEILFNYGDRFAHLEGRRLTAVPRFYVTGQRSRPVYPLATGPIGIVIVSLFPWGLRALFPQAAEMIDGYQDLFLLPTRPRMVDLEDRLLAAEDQGTRVRLVEEFLVSQRATTTVDRRMISAAHMLATDGRRQMVQDVAERFSMSRRHFARTFHDAIGIQAKMFSRIMRFQQAISLRRSTRLPWVDIAATCGYSDQAHLNHDVKEFSRKTPGRIDLERRAVAEVFNGQGVSGFFDTVYL